MQACVGFRRLNIYCVRERYLSPSVLEAVKSTKQIKQVYSQQAIENYHQIKLAQESKNLITFLTPSDCFHYKRAPIGINATGEHYNRRMSGLQGFPNITKAVDDNAVYSADDLTIHATFVRKFLTRCSNVACNCNLINLFLPNQK